MERRPEDARTLYFEDAGMWLDDCADVGNPRIRSAFTADDGNRYFIEVHGNPYSQEWRKAYPEICKGERISWLELCFQITQSQDNDECVNRLDIDHNLLFPYTLEGIREAINKHLNCSFERVEVLPELAGYCAYAPNWRSAKRNVDKYRYGDEFVYDRESTEKAERIKAEELQKQIDMGEKHPCLSAYRDEDDFFLLHIDHHRQNLGNPIFRLD